MHLFKPAHDMAVLETEASPPGEAGGSEFRELAGGEAGSPKMGYWPQWAYPLPLGVGISEVGISEVVPAQQGPIVHGRDQICIQEPPAKLSVM